VRGVLRAIDGKGARQEDVVELKGEGLCNKQRLGRLPSTEPKPAAPVPT
jgi:hypothetical protein